MDAKKTSDMFPRIAQNGDSVQSLSSTIEPSRADERRSAHWRLCALDAPGGCSLFVLSTWVTHEVDVFVQSVRRPRNLLSWKFFPSHVRWCSS